VRNRRGPAGEGRALEHYVNDRPFVVSSFLSAAIAEVFGSALSGKSKERPELVDCPLPLQIRISVLPCRGGEAFLRRLFEPLGYTVSATGHRLDEKFQEWGESAYIEGTPRDVMLVGQTVYLAGFEPVRKHQLRPPSSLARRGVLQAGRLTILGGLDSALAFNRPNPQAPPQSIASLPCHACNNPPSDARHAGALVRALD
jgi:hypothetical protein